MCEVILFIVYENLHNDQDSTIHCHDQTLTNHWKHGRYSESKPGKSSPEAFFFYITDSLCLTEGL